MQIKQFSLGDVFTRCYVLSENNKALVIDPGAEAEKIYEYLKKNNLDLKLIINTHGHFDHIGANEFLKEKSDAEILIHAKAADKLVSAEKNLSLKFLRKEITSPTADKLLEDGDLIDFESLTLKVLYTPGHSQGGISIYIDSEKVLFSGDAIFSNGIGRTDLLDSDID
jgi:glyoxylase-like metal-dependent hydrolase (beta-lactamase superfamily II)